MTTTLARESCYTSVEPDLARDEKSVAVTWLCVEPSGISKILRASSGPYLQEIRISDFFGERHCCEAMNIVGNI